MKRSHSASCAKAVLLLALLACATLPAWGQGCALCYTQAGLTVMSYKKRNRFNPPSDADSKNDLGW
jgi:hypothetical protein